tara:strand:- start:144 stop:491 length:348 start_codon:yes stop_codon:yes gene_type:complete
MSNNGNIFLEIIEEEEKDANDEDLNDEDLEELNRLKEITEKLWSEDHLTHTYENIKKNEKKEKTIRKIQAIQSNFNFSFRKKQKPVNKNLITNENKNNRTVQRKNKTRYRGFMSF